MKNIVNKHLLLTHFLEMIIMQNPKRTEERKNNAAKFNERKVKFWKIEAVSFFVNHAKYVTCNTQKSKWPKTNPRIEPINN